MSFVDSLRGYSFPVHCRDGFRCHYCGLDGREWPNWLYLSRDHLLPEGHPKRDDRAFIVTACLFCNTAANRKVFEVEGKTPEELVEQKRPYVEATRAAYKDFWEGYVRSCPDDQR